MARSWDNFHFYSGKKWEATEGQEIKRNMSQPEFQKNALPALLRTHWGRENGGEEDRQDTAETQGRGDGGPDEGGGGSGRAEWCGFRNHLGVQISLSLEIGVKSGSRTPPAL